MGVYHQLINALEILVLPRSRTVKLMSLEMNSGTTANQNESLLIEPGYNKTDNGTADSSTGEIQPLQIRQPSDRFGNN
jgi:hypothetical protein